MRIVIDFHSSYQLDIVFVPVMISPIGSQETALGGVCRDVRDLEGNCVCQPIAYKWQCTRVWFGGYGGGGLVSFTSTLLEKETTARVS